MDLFDVVTTSSSTRHMEFKDEWFTRSEGFKALVNADIPELEVGGVIATRAPADNRLLVIGTPFGNVVVMEVDRDKRHALLYSTPAIEGLFGHCYLPDDQLEGIIGAWGKDNIGHRLAKFSTIHETKGG